MALHLQVGQRSNERLDDPHEKYDVKEELGQAHDDFYWRRQLLVLVYVEASLVDRVCDQEQEAKESDFGAVPLEDIHYDSVAEGDQKTQ